jgi:predicted Zn-dependent protease
MALNMKITLRILVLFSVTFIVACGIVNEKNKGKGFNILPISTDKNLGLQTEKQIASDSRQYPILDPSRYAEVYAYVNKVKMNILNSGKVDFKDDFAWKIHIIQDDNTLNAFCTPGGYIYVYTGILKFLESEDQLAGVLAHEIGHADMRHSTRQITLMYGVQGIVDVTQLILLGKTSPLLSQVTTSLIGLKNSRSHETEADQRSVLYLCNTPYNADGGAGFFEKLQKQNQGGNPPQFLSTHPNPDNRIEHFHNSRVTMGCSGRNDFKAEYQKMLTKLPK